MKQSKGQQQYEQLKQKLDSIQKSILDIKANSVAMRNSRQQRLNQFKHLQTKQQLKFQEEFQTFKKSNLSSFKVESLGGLVVQVPQNQHVHPNQVNPYSEGQPKYYISQITKNYQKPKSQAREHIETSLQILKALEKSKLPHKKSIQSKMLRLPVSPQCEGLKTIVFDLDQTLIHCNDTIQLPHDLKITIRFPTGEQTVAGINIRPGAIELLQLLKGKYEVMIFTASHSCYANQILNNLDPKGDLIQHRLYRQHCHISNQGYYIKDLRIINRPLKNLLLVDNAAYSYAYQLQNGVPILPYFQGKNDFELKVLGQYLMSLHGESDIRRANHKIFKLNRYLQFVGKTNQLVEQLYL